MQKTNKASGATARPGMISLADVAERAQVSPTTASFVLNNLQKQWNIADATAERVRKAAQDMGYQRNELARSVRSGKNYVLGFVKRVVAPESDNTILNGVLNVAAEAGYLVKLLPYVDRREESQDEAYELVSSIVAQRLAGIAMIGFYRSENTRAFYEKLSSYNIPVIFVDDDITIPGSTCVTSDDDMGYRLAIEHLIDLGHSRIAFLAGDSVHVQSVRRKQSYRSIMLEHGLTVPERYVADTAWILKDAEILTAKMFNEVADRPTALLCAGDKVAAVAMRALHRMGLNVPGDVSVVGYSDFEFAELLDPSLTTISQPFFDMGRVATRLLLDRLRSGTSGDSPPLLALPTALVVRESTGPVKSRR